MWLWLIDLKMKMRIIATVENHTPSFSQLILKPELWKMGHSAEQSHVTSEEAKAGEVACAGSVTSRSRAEAELLVLSVIFTVFGELCSLFDQRAVQRC